MTLHRLCNESLPHASFLDSWFPNRAKEDAEELRDRKIKKSNHSIAKSLNLSINTLFACSTTEGNPGRPVVDGEGSVRIYATRKADHTRSDRAGLDPATVEKALGQFDK